MLEYEKKIMLSADEYTAISAAFCRGIVPKTQTNYYFDNDELSMNQKGITYRIRAKDGKYTATIKSHNAQHPDCSVEVDLVEKTKFDPQIFGEFGVHYQGELVTERLILYKDSACEMVLDRNVYLGYTDFELEVEYDKESECCALRRIENISHFLVATEHLSGIDELLARIGQGGSKSQRFFERLKQCE